MKIDAWFRRLAGLKRKPEDDADNDDFQQQSLSRTKKQRIDPTPAAETIEVNPAQVRPRRMMLDCVEIFIAKRSTDNVCAEHDRRQRSSSPDEIIHVNEATSQPASSSPTPERISWAPLSASGRSRRRSTRPLFMGMDGTFDDSDYEPAPPKPSSRKRKAPPSDSASDFQDTGTRGDDEDDYDNASVVSERSSATSPNDDFSEDDHAVFKRRPKTAKKTTSGEASDTVDASTKESEARKPSAKRMENLVKRIETLDTTLPPLHDIKDIFFDITKRGLKFGLDRALRAFQGRPLRVATMCSGTESPLLALELVRDALKALSPSLSLEVEHIFSAEIVPYKQAYIERNFAPPVVFRDVAEFIDAVKEQQPHATTAYGAVVPIPGDPDIVVAGTSCVDFSNLNNKKKGLGDGGESDRTWHGALAYCTKYRPAMIIFENVQGADWDIMLETYEALGYNCKGVHLDTKAFYIPHTRQRGYMVCLDTSRLEGSPNLAGTWTELMHKFKRTASSPASAFLIPNDQVTVRQSIRDDDAVRDVDWAICEVTQMQYRQEDLLGNARPWTNWQESGTLLPPERGSAHWYRSQVERVLDTLDCCILRKALPGKKSDKNKQAEKGGMYDVRYKTRIWDLSQNVYRNRDNIAFGITGCITPSGQFFISDAGRAMAPEETLILQGLPLHKISFTTESPREVQDLAGNAMTTTVVGCAVLASLIVAKDLLGPRSEMAVAGGSKSDSRQSLNLVSRKGSTVEADVAPAAFNVSQILQQASRATRKCYCEKSTGIGDKNLRICQDCGHTCCARCAGNPEHRYIPLVAPQRVKPDEFEATLRAQLPLVLRFPAQVSRHELQSQTSGIKDQKALEAYLDAVQNAANATYRFSHVRRTHCWTIVYSTPGQHGHLDLVIEGDCAEWRLFAIPSKNLPVEHELRTNLIEPVARSPVKECLYGDQWQWRVLKRESVHLEITGEGAQVPTWWARMKLPQFTQHKQWERLRITSSFSSAEDETVVDGLYQYLPSCGTACEGLYKRIEPASSKPLYLFLDPTATGHPDKDQYVFSRSVETLEYHEVRPIVASISSSWRPWTAMPRFGMPSEIAQLPDNFREIMPIRSRWITPKRSMALTSPEMRIAMSKAETLNMPVDVLQCQNTALLLSCEVPTSDLILHGDDLNKAKDVEFLEANAWLFEAMRRHLPSGIWHEIAFPTDECRSCAPSPPAVRWRLADEKAMLVPYEDPASAALYERSIKSRPDPLIVLLGLKDKLATVQFGINLASLAHRVVSRLPARASVGDVSLVWKVETSAAPSSIVVKPFTLKATTEVLPCEADQGMTVTLFPKQRLALAWMQEQEKGVTFALEESEEAFLSGLGWRAEVRAQKFIEVRGGICADHPGFGKTITSLALVHSDFTPSSGKAVADQLRKRQEALGHKPLLPTAATLIICPNSLVKQWISEAREKLNHRLRDKGFGEIVSIVTVSDLDKYAISDFERARLIIVNRGLFSNDQYAERLATFAGVPGPSTKQGRAYYRWLQYATKEVPDHISIMQQSTGRLKAVIKTKYQERLACEDFRAYVPSKRLKGKELAAATSEKAAKIPKVQPALPSLDMSHVLKPLLEMFYFNRMIVDEFHQYEPKEYAAIIALRADKRWGLSATPAMDDFYDIAQTASLLDVPLRCGSDSRGVMKQKNVKKFRADQTAFERFDGHRIMSSTTAHERINELDQLFLDKFVRRNIMDHAEMAYRDALVPVALDLDHRVHYTELSQHLNSLDMRIKRGKKKNATDRDQRLSEAVKSSTSAEEALTKTAAVLCREDDDYNGIHSLIAKSKDEVKRLKQDIIKPLRLASKHEKYAFTSWVQNRLTAGSLGDQATVEYLQEQMDAFGIKVLPPSTKKTVGADGDDPKSKEAGAKTHTTELSSTAGRLVVSQRSLRFYENVGNLQDAYSGKRKLDKSCENAECTGRVKSTDDLAVSAFCGHIICKACYQINHAKQCVSSECSSRMDATHLLWASKLDGLGEMKAAPYGQKMSTAIKLLKTIQKQKDQAILFVQFGTELAAAKQALAAEKIAALVIDKVSDAHKLVERFCAKNSTDTVIVLNASDETAAGLNLQNANHVIFFSPLLRDSQYGYDSTMAQAVGRVKRYGQKKQIYVYRLVALNTIDVDILEHRERRSTALTQMDGPDVIPPRPTDDATEVDTKLQRTQLVKEGGFFSLRPRDWLLGHGEQIEGQKVEVMKKRDRVHGWEDFSSLVKWSKTYTDDDDE